MARSGAEPAMEWTFSDGADATSYLREVGVLWGVWGVGLVALFAIRGLGLIAVGLVLLVTLLFAARPLQRRAAAVKATDEGKPSTWAIATGRATPRDRAIRELSYGSAPVQAALDKIGASRNWVFMRHLLVVATVAAFLYVLVAT